MTPKEDQQPMTTREELVALRDWIRRPDYAEEFSFDDIIDWINERPVATVERLASRQEVSVTVPRVTDNDRDEITVTLDGKEIRGWSYSSDQERRTKMLCAREYVEGFCTGRQS